MVRHSVRANGSDPSEEGPDLARPVVSRSGAVSLNQMLPRTYDGQNCSIARALEVVGERWTLLLLRDALLGVRRFDAFQASLGIATNVLASRLAHLVDTGLLRREPYSE